MSESTSLCASQLGAVQSLRRLATEARRRDEGKRSLRSQAEWRSWLAKGRHMDLLHLKSSSKLLIPLSQTPSFTFILSIESPFSQSINVE
jgi:hypothetical protein